MSKQNNVPDSDASPRPKADFFDPLPFIPGAAVVHDAPDVLEERLKWHQQQLKQREGETLPWMLKRHLQGKGRWSPSTFVPYDDILKRLLSTTRLPAHPGRGAPPEVLNTIKKDWTAALGNRAALLSTVGAWRVWRGIYRIDPSVLKALWATQSLASVPVELLGRLPEPVIYVPTPGLPFLIDESGVVKLNGFYFAFEDAGKSPMMILGLDIAGQGLLGITLELAAESLEESIRLNFRHQPDLLILKDDNGMEDAVAIYSRYISVVLYLCSRTGQRDIIPPASRRERPQPGTAPKTVKLAFENTVWDVGTSMGQALRAAFTEQEDVPTGNTLRSHIRRSHWHTFLSGPRTGPRIRTLKWLPPVLIKFDQEQGDPDVSSTVVHPDLTPPDQEPGD